MRGDEFAVFVDSIPGPECALLLARDLVSALEAPYEVDGTDVYIGATVGVAFADRHEPDTSAILRQADVAMVRAKATGVGVGVFDSALAAEVAERLSLDVALRRAVSRDELRVELARVVELATAEVRGQSAVSVWDRPGRGRQVLADFMPHAEATGLALEIGSLPVDIVQLDAAFLLPTHAGRADEVRLLVAVIGIADALGVELVVDGIATTDARELVSGMRARLGQGALFDPLAARAPHHAALPGGHDESV